MVHLVHIVHAYIILTFSHVFVASVVLCLSILTLVILGLCCCLWLYDWCLDNSASIKQEAIQQQMANDNLSVSHLPSNSFDNRPNIDIEI